MAGGWWRRIARPRWRTLFSRRRVEAELEAELRDHLERKTELYRERGWNERGARRQARLDLGGVEQAKERCREQWRLQWVHDLTGDLSHGLRLARRSPGFTLAAVLTLALGLGPNVALFSAVNGLLFRLLPLPRANRVMMVRAQLPGGFSSTIPYPAVESLGQQSAKIFTGVAGASLLNFDGMTWRGAGAPVRVSTNYVTGNFFSVLDLQPALGRLLAPRDGAAAWARPVAILSYRFWRRRFGGDRGVIGRAARINGQEVTIIGVAARGFPGILPLIPTDVYLPLGMGVRTRDLARRFAGQGNAPLLTAVARLRPGVSPEQARAGLQVIARRWAASYLGGHMLRGFSIQHLGGILPFSNGISLVRVAAIFLLLAGLVLAVAAINVAGLLLARAVERAPEMALRAALGARRGRLVRQALAEGLVLAAMGGAVGAALAAAGMRWLAAWKLPGLPMRMDFPLDWQALAYAAGIAVA
ncbi:MAG: ABC transporter permease, partial [Terriglobales bacterium]